jgi:hypothetical protein
MDKNFKFEVERVKRLLEKVKKPAKIATSRLWTQAKNVNPSLETLIAEYVKAINTTVTTTDAEGGYLV